MIRAKTNGMKTGEWIIKLLSYVLCLCAVCAGFAYKERQANAVLSEYMKRTENEKTDRLFTTLIKLKESLKSCVSDEKNGDFPEVGRLCKNAVDAVADCMPDKSSEALRAFFIRVKTVCESYDNEKPDMLKHQMLSELYMRLTAMEEALKAKKYSAETLIKTLSSGLKTEDKKEDEKPEISRMRAGKKARAEVRGITLNKCEKNNGGYVFSSSGSFVRTDGEGDTLMISRTVTEGRERYDVSSGMTAAKEHISDITGAPSDAVFLCDAFGMLYYNVTSDEKNYPVGIDKTDGKVVFEVISRS